MHRPTVFTDGGEVGCSLSVEQTEFLQIGARQGLQATALALVEQGFEFRPVWLALLDPAGRNHG